MKCLLWIFSLCCFILSIQAQGQTCTPAKTGNPCASSSRAPSLNLGAGNPIHLMSGNKFQQEDDLWMRLSGLEIVRYYNSSSSTSSVMGVGWQASYNTQLFPLKHNWQIILDDGQRVMFHPPDGSQAQAVEHHQGYLLHDKMNWKWITPQGLVRTFNSHGYLIEITIPGFPTTHIQRTEKDAPSLISSITSGDETLRYYYHRTPQGVVLQKIDSPIGSYLYSYDIPIGHQHHRLIKLTRPDGWTKQYLYEPEKQAGNPYLLTGISITTPTNKTTRINEWRYNTEGLANYSQSLGYDPLFIDYVKLAKQHNQESHTIVRNQQGHQTHIKGIIKKGHFLLTEVTGDGCYLCPRVGTKATYNEDGFMTFINGYHIQRNRQNKVQHIRLEHPFWGTIQLDYDVNGIPQTWHSQYTGKQNISFPDVYELTDKSNADASLYLNIQDKALIFNNNLNLNQNNSKDNLQQTLILRDSSRNQHLWSQQRHYSQEGLLLKEDFDFPLLKKTIHNHYLYDNNHRLVASKQTINGITQHFYYQWALSGQNNAYAIGTQTTIPIIIRDKQGLPLVYNDWQLRYGSHKRISEVSKNNQLYARYDYDKLGRRIKKETKNTTTTFSYASGKLVSEQQINHCSVDNKQPCTITTRQRDYIYSGLMLVAFTDTVIDNEGKRTQQLFYVHNDHLGQVNLITDKQQHIVWAAHYSPTGEATIFVNQIVFNLRQPGQYFDQETGWHDNYLRTYDPKAGHYLEPDPMGPTYANDPFGYVRQQPRHFIDPLGLLLFAFDGTTNSIASNTNVWKFYQLYNGPKFYKEGPGGIPGESLLDKVGGALFSTTTEKILDEHKQNLINYMRSKNQQFDDPIPIDIVGFSRGAAIGMVFSNYVKSLVKNGLFHYRQQYEHNGLEYIQDIQTCVDLRFIGLFDTVAQFGANGLGNFNYNYTAAPEWELISHAVALNEYRYLLPLTSYAPLASEKNSHNTNVIEQGFLGSHTEAGGVHVEGDATSPKNPHKDKFYGDLSHIPLAWTYTQAQNLGIDLKPLSSITNKNNMPLDEIHNALMHNTYGEYYTQSPIRQKGVEIGGLSTTQAIRTRDRSIETAGSITAQEKQGNTVHIGDDIRKKHQTAGEAEFIDTKNSELHMGSVGIYGIVNAQKYLSWLENTLNWTAPIKSTP